MESLQANLEHLSRARFIVSGLVERAQNHLPLDFLERRADWKTHRIFGAQPRAFIERIRREVMPLDLFSRANDHRAFDHIAQLAHVARPRVKAQRVKRSRTEKPRGPIVFSSQ